MKKPIPYPPKRCNAEFKDICQRISDLIAALPTRIDYSGREAALASWIRVEDRERILKCTEDPLSYLFKDDLRDSAAFRERTQSEKIVAEVLKTNSTFLDFGAIEKFAALGTKQYNQKIRTTRLITQPNRRGRRVEFALPENVPLILNNVFDVWKNGIDAENDVYAALWIMVGILNAHPFTDGNGRLSRALMNAYLIKSDILRHGPLPLGPLVYAAAGNYVFAVRRVLMTGDWAQLGKVMLGMLKVYASFLDEFENHFYRK